MNMALLINLGCKTQCFIVSNNIVLKFVPKFYSYSLLLASGIRKNVNSLSTVTFVCPDYVSLSESTSQIQQSFLRQIQSSVCLVVCPRLSLLCKHLDEIQSRMVHGLKLSIKMLNTLQQGWC